MTGRVDNSLGEPANNSAIGAVIICIHSQKEDGCHKGEIVCEIDRNCGMCQCVRTDDNGEFSIQLIAPGEYGEYQLSVP